MKSTTYNMFSLNIKSIEGFLTEEECKIIAENIYKNKQRLHNNYWVLEGNYDVSFTVLEDILPFIDKDTNLNLKERMQQAVDEYSMENNIIENSIEKSWALAQKKESILVFHNHLKRSPKLPGADSVISGSLFIDTPAGCADLEFKHPIDFHSSITKESPKLKFTPKNGTFMLWPSYVFHGHSEWNSTDVRTVLSFSSYPKKEVQNV